MLARMRQHLDEEVGHVLDQFVFEDMHARCVTDLIEEILGLSEAEGALHAFSNAEPADQTAWVSYRVGLNQASEPAAVQVFRALANQDQVSADAIVNAEVTPAGNQPVRQTSVCIATREENATFARSYDAVHIEF